MTITMGPRLDPESVRSRLKATICDTDLQPQPGANPGDVTTFCNFFVHRVAAWWGCRLLDDEKGEPLMAVKMVALFDLRSDKFKRLNPVFASGEALPPAAQPGPVPVLAPAVDGYPLATELACGGSLVIAGRGPLPGHAHGHVCIVAPESQLQYSGTWNKKVSQIANVGMRNFYGEAASHAFATPADPREPGLWLYLG
jgi:hypothetical protein